MSVTAVTEVIPRKSKGKCGGGTRAAASSATRGKDTEGAAGDGCALRKKYPPSISNARKKTHTPKKSIGSGIGMAPLSHFNLDVAMAITMTMVSPLVKKANFATLKQEAKKAKCKVKTTKKELKHAGKHGKSKKKEKYYSSSSSSSSSLDIK